MKMIITRGNVASGKTTWALQWVGDHPSRARVERDEIRALLYGKYLLDNPREEVVTQVHETMIESLLREGKDVVVSDTNLRADTVKRLYKVADKFGAEVEFQDFDTPLDECIRRNKLRSRAVPEDVIRRFHSRYFRKGALPPIPERSQNASIKGVTPYLAEDTLPHAIIVDLDGTIAYNNGHRGFFEWKKVGADTLIEATASIVKMFQERDDVEVIFMSGRDAICRPESTEWLARHGFKVDKFYMRPQGSMEKDSKVKLDLFNSHLRDKYYIEAVFDDRLSVCELWFELGLPLFRVGDPNANF